MDVEITSDGEKIISIAKSPSLENNLSHYILSYNSGLIGISDEFSNIPNEQYYSAFITNDKQVIGEGNADGSIYFHKLNPSQEYTFAYSKTVSNSPIIHL